jgi:hypothetical protein
MAQHRPNGIYFPELLFIPFVADASSPASLVESSTGSRMKIPPGSTNRFQLQSRLPEFFATS